MWIAMFHFCLSLAVRRNLARTIESPVRKERRKEGRRKRKTNRSSILAARWQNEADRGTTTTNTDEGGYNREPDWHMHTRKLGPVNYLGGAPRTSAIPTLPCPWPSSELVIASPGQLPNFDGHATGVSSVEDAIRRSICGSSIGDAGQLYSGDSERSYSANCLESAK